MSRFKELWLEKFEEAQTELGYDDECAGQYANDEVTDMYTSLVDKIDMYEERDYVS